MKQDEYLLWKQWKATKDINKLNELFNSFQPIVQNAVNTFKTVPIPREALELEAKRLLYSGLSTYDPRKGTKLNTHLFNQLRPLHRFVYKNQNIAYIPEARIRQIGTYKYTVSQLRDSLGREPTATEVADKMGIGIDEVTRLEKELRKQYVMGLEDFEGYFSMPSKKLDALFYVYNELDPKQKLVFEYTTGLTGKSQITKYTDLAKKLKMDVYEVRKIKKQIAKKLEPFSDL